MSNQRQIIATVLALGVAASAYAFDFSSIQSAVTNNPQVQQQVGAQVMQHPQLLTGAATSGAGMVGNLSGTQKTQLMNQANSVAAKLFSPSEQNSLKAFQATPDGASIMAKLPTLMQQMAPTILQIYAGGAK